MDSMLCSSAFPPASAVILFSHVSQGQGSFVTFGDFVDLLVYLAFFQYPEIDLLSDKVRLLCTVCCIARASINVMSFASAFVSYMC